ncbi:MAG: PQQ-binding-like beta-propeller repeat protein [Bacteroidetes bacterium]|jgi:hypothetical protein|nr:PQQ-binding-like beta-propeller repeat protein [Bacteroidota bacterium]
MKFICSFLLIIVFISTHAQQFKKKYDYDIERSFGSLLKNDLTEFEISPNGNHVMMLTSEYVKILNKDGNEIFNYQCVPKTNSKSSLFSDLIGGEIGRMISNIRLDEGNGFWLYEKENLIIILDWNLDKNLIMGFDLTTGEKLWEVDKYRYTPGKDEQLGLVLAATAASAVASQSFSMGAILAEEAFKSIQTEALSRDGFGSKRAGAFITPLPGTDDFLLTHSEGISSINKKTGIENWTYDKRPLKIGEAKVLKDYNEVMLVNYNPKAITDSKTNYSPNYFIKDGYLVRLDLNTGKENAKVDVKGSFSKNRIHILENMYIVDFFGPEAYDLKTNKLVYEAISQETYEEDKKIKTVKLEKDWVKPSKSVFDGNYIYYVRSDFNTKGKWIYAHDIKTGEKVWQTNELDDTASIEDITDETLLIKEFGIGKNFFTNIDKSTGEILFGPVKVKQPLMVDKRKPWLFTTQNHLVHNGKRLYFLDKETLEEEKDIKLKKAKIGDVYAMDLLSSGFIMVGDKGVAFYDRAGNFQSNLKIKNVERSLWTDDYMLLMTEGNLLSSGDIYVINIDQQKQVDKMEISDMTVFSSNLNHVIKADSDVDTRLEFYSIE